MLNMCKSILDRLSRVTPRTEGGEEKRSRKGEKWEGKPRPLRKKGDSRASEAALTMKEKGIKRDCRPEKDNKKESRSKKTQVKKHGVKTGAR